MERITLIHPAQPIIAQLTKKMCAPANHVTFSTYLRSQSMRVEILNGVERRRQWSDDEKARITEETSRDLAKDFGGGSSAWGWPQPDLRLVARLERMSLASQSAAPHLILGPCRRAISGDCCDAAPAGDDAAAFWAIYGRRRRA